MELLAQGRDCDIFDRGDGTIASDVLDALPAAIRPPAG